MYLRMYKKVASFLLVFLFIASCADTFGSVKRGLTGEKANTADEFLVQKKDPLILPPDFENLPTPDERAIAVEESSIFEATLETTIEEDNATGSVEGSILKKIQKQ